MKMKLRIRDLREDADLAQRQVAEYLHCDQSLYSKYERGERALPLEICRKSWPRFTTSPWTTSPAFLTRLGPSPPGVVPGGFCC